MLTSLHLHERGREVRSSSASLKVIGQVTEHTIVKWPIVESNLGLHVREVIPCFYDLTSECCEHQLSSL